jgi:protein-disulfide isomerase
MVNLDNPQRAFWKRLRVILDTAASLAVVIGATVLVLRMSPATRTDPPRNREIPVPEAPLSLEGAALIGDPAAQAVMLEFSDFECPFCGKFSAQVLPTLHKQYIESGRLLLAFRHLPLKIHPNAQPAALAASCAAEQNKFAPFHDLLFANPKALDADSLSKYASAVGLDRRSYSSCLEATAPGKVTADTDLAKLLGVTGTPAFFVGIMGPERQLIVRQTIKGVRPMNEFTAAVDDALAAR